MGELSPLPKRCHWLGITSLSDLVLISQGLWVTVAISDSWAQGSLPSWPLKQLWLQTYANKYTLIFFGPPHTHSIRIHHGHKVLCNHYFMSARLLLRN